MRPAPSRAATRAATSRPHAVEPARIAHGCSRARDLGDRDARRLLRRSRRRGARSRRRPTRGASAVSLGVDRDDEDVARERGRRAEELARVVHAIGFGRRRSCAVDRGGVGATGGPACASARRAVERAALVQQAHGFAHLVGERRFGLALPGAGDRHDLHRRRPTSATRPGPTGPGRGRPRRGARMRSAGTAARPGGSTLAGSMRRSAHERIAGQVAPRPAASRRRARSARRRACRRSRGGARR